MALSRQGNRIQPLVAGMSGALLAALGFAAASAPAQAASTSNSLANCKVVIDGKDLGTKFSKAPGGNTSINLEKAKITACDTEIVAKQAHGTGIDFDDSTWTFTGDVHIRLGEQQARLGSDEAVAKFLNKEVAHLELTGNPAEFEQKRPKSDEVIRGHANNIVYESQAGTITLQGDVWLTGSGKEFKGPSLVYDIGNAEVTKTGREGNVHIVIDPQAAKDQKKKDEDKKPPPPTPP